MARPDDLVLEREAVLREREAVRRAVAEVWQSGRFGASLGRDWYGSDALAERLYPLPKVTRPRVVQDVAPAREWRVIDGAIQTRVVGGGLGYCEWHATNSHDHWVTILPARVRIWADLLANPTEEVEDV